MLLLTHPGVHGSNSIRQGRYKFGQLFVGTTWINRNIILIPRPLPEASRHEPHVYQSRSLDAKNIDVRLLSWSPSRANTPPQLYAQQCAVKAV
jgi:hypothetical protein